LLPLLQFDFLLSQLVSVGFAMLKSVLGLVLVFMCQHVH